MPASAILTIRSLVMIASTIAIPGLAVMSYSSPPPAAIKKGPKPAPSARSRAPFGSRLFCEQAMAAETTASRNDFIAARTIDAAPVALKHTDLEVRPAQATKPLRAPAFWSDEPRTTTNQPSHNEQVEDEVASSSPAESLAVKHLERDDHRLHPTGRRMTEPSPGEQNLPIASERPVALNNQQFAVMEDRLRTLGATHYRLETWGAQGELFRFRAMMSVSARSNHNRYFEATDREPLRAVERVVEQVERWRAGQTQPQDAR